MHKVSWLLILAYILVSCTPSRVPERTIPTSFIEVTGDTATRVERISAMLAQGSTLPTPLRDAQFVEVKLGDGELGPADYRAFILLEVAPDAVSQWVNTLTPLPHPPTYAEPGQPYAWWVDAARFATLDYYAPDSLTQRTNGWVAIDAARGQIYIYTYTT